MLTTSHIRGTVSPGSFAFNPVPADEPGKAVHHGQHRPGLLLHRGQTWQKLWLLALPGPGLPMLKVNPELENRFSWTFLFSPFCHFAYQSLQKIKVYVNIILQEINNKSALRHQFELNSFQS